MFVSNIDPSAVDFTPVRSDGWIGSAFVTDSSASAFSLDDIVLSLGFGGGESSPIIVGVYSDSANAPRALLETLIGPAEPFFAGLYTYESSGLSLAADTKYWVVVGVGISILCIPGICR